MFKDISDQDLLILLNITNPEDFLLLFNPNTTERRLRELIKRDSPTKTRRVGAIMNKAIFIGSVPIEVVWMLVSLGIVTSLSLLVMLGIFTVIATSLLGWYAVTFAADERVNLEHDVQKEKLAMQIKSEILTLLQQRVRKELSDEFNNWQKMIHSPRSLKYLGCDSELMKTLTDYYNENYQEANHKFLQRPFNIQPPPVAKPPSFVFPILSCAVASTLLVSFFWGSSEIIAALGFGAISAAMISPVGVLIAGCIALGVGIYIGYQRYEYQKYIHEIKFQTKMIAYENQNRLNDYFNGNMLLGKLSKTRQEEESTCFQETLQQFELLKSLRQNQKSPKLPEIKLDNDASTNIEETQITWNVAGVPR